MKNLSSYNLITFFNYLKIRELNEDCKHQSHFYDISFEIEDVTYENAIKAFGLYPVPFFALKTSYRQTSANHAEAIRNIWLSAHFESLITGKLNGLTLTSPISNAEDLHGNTHLSDQYWTLLQTQSRDPLSKIDSALAQIGRNSNLNNLPPPVREEPKDSLRRITPNSATP